MDIEKMIAQLAEIDSKGNPDLLQIFEPDLLQAFKENVQQFDLTVLFMPPLGHVLIHHDRVDRYVQMQILYIYDELLYAEVTVSDIHEASDDLDLEDVQESFNRLLAKGIITYGEHEVVLTCKELDE
jgi:hypothetical protein